MNNGKIGLLDSGVGGLTVLKELLEIMPNEDYIYFGDSKNNPYGEKSEKEIQTMCLKIGGFLENKGAKIILLACNTATKASLEGLENNLNIPVIGILKSGIKMAVEETNNKKIGVVATNFTAKNKAYSEALEKYYPNSHHEYSILEIGSSRLANKIENGFADDREKDALVFNLVKQIPKDFDCLILGCTHFPFIKEKFQKYFQNKVLDPSRQMAKDAKVYIENNQLENKKIKGSIEIYTSGDREKFQKIAEKILSVDKEIIKEIRL